MSSYPRPLNDRERSLLNYLLSYEFPGVEALRIQARTARARDVSDEPPPLVLFDVSHDTPLATDVAFTVPIDARVRDVDPPQEVLLFVTHGRLQAIELVDYSRAAASDLPSPDKLEEPTVYIRGRYPAAGRRSASSLPPRADED